MNTMRTTARAAVTPIGVAFSTLADDHRGRRIDKESIREHTKERQ
jgi:hypothetical protein